MSLRSKGSLEEGFSSLKSRNHSERKINNKNEGLYKSRKKAYRASCVNICGFRIDLGSIRRLEEGGSFSKATEAY